MPSKELANDASKYRLVIRPRGQESSGFSHFKHRHEKRRTTYKRYIMLCARYSRRYTYVCVLLAHYDYKHYCSIWGAHQWKPKRVPHVSPSDSSSSLVGESLNSSTEGSKLTGYIPHQHARASSMIAKITGLCQKSQKSLETRGRSGGGGGVDHKPRLPTTPGHGSKCQVFAGQVLFHKNRYDSTSCYHSRYPCAATVRQTVEYSAGGRGDGGRGGGEGEGYSNDARLRTRPSTFSYRDSDETPSKPACGGDLNRSCCAHAATTDRVCIPTPRQRGRGHQKPTRSRKA